MRVAGKISVMGAVALLVAACTVRTNIINIGQKTSLERQLMGELEPLSEEELLIASVRAGAGGGPGGVDEHQARALAARRRQLFNRDDVDELKAWGCVGEAQEAQLVDRPCEQAADAEVAARRARILEQENRDRAAIIDWVLAADAVLTPAERPQVVAFYHRLLVDRAQPGHWLQGVDGSWARR